MTFRRPETESETENEITAETETEITARETGDRDDARNCPASMSTLWREVRGDERRAVDGRDLPALLLESNGGARPMSESNSDPELEIAEHETETTDYSRRGLYYWCSYSHSAPLHGSLDCAALRAAMDEETRERYLNLVVIRGDARGIRFCGICVNHGDHDGGEG